MIKCYIDITKNEFSLEHDACCVEHVTDEMTKVLDYIIADYEIKISPRLEKLSTEEKESLLLCKRKEYLEAMAQKECFCKDYL